MKKPQLREIPLHLIDPDPEQPRKVFNDDKLSELVESMRENGLLQPISVKKVEGRYRLIAGERRFRSATLLEWKEIPALVLDVSDLEAVKLQLLENIVRADLDPVETARAYNKLLDGGMTAQEIASTVGIQPRQVLWYVQMLNAREDVLHLVAKGQIKPTVAHRISGLTLDGQARVIRSMTTSEMSLVEVLTLCDRIHAEESQVEMFPNEPVLTDDEVVAARTFRTAIERAFAALEELRKLEMKNEGVISRAVATELDGSVAKIQELRRRLIQIERALLRRDVVEIPAAEMTDTGAPVPVTA